MTEPFETPRASAPEQPRAVPFHCPYCGEQDLWPIEDGGWECHGCLRAFSVRMLGMVRPKAVET